MTATRSHERQRRAELRRAGKRGGARAPRSHPASPSRPLGPLRPAVGSLTSGGSRGAEGPGGRRLWSEGGRRWDTCLVPATTVFFPPITEWGRLKMAAASLGVGDGNGILFRRCSPAKPRRSHLGLAGRASCQRHKMAEPPPLPAARLCRLSRAPG